MIIRPFELSFQCTFVEFLGLFLDKILLYPTRKLPFSLDTINKLRACLNLTLWATYTKFDSVLRLPAEASAQAGCSSVA